MTSTLVPDPSRMDVIEVKRGDEATIPLTMRVTVEEEVEPVDLTGIIVQFTARDEIGSDEIDDDDAAISKTISSHIDADAGQTALGLTSTDTDQEPGDYYCDFQADLPDFGITSSPTFILRIQPDQTKRT